MSATVVVVGLRGAAPARALAGAGCAVSLEFARLEVSDLLVFAPAPPEPAPWALTRHLRERSAIRVLALVPEDAGDERRRSLEAGADGCLASTSTDEELVAAVGALLGHRPGSAGIDEQATDRMAPPGNACRSDEAGRVTGQGRPSAGRHGTMVLARMIAG